MTGVVALVLVAGLVAVLAKEGWRRWAVVYVLSAVIVLQGLPATLILFVTAPISLILLQTWLRSGKPHIAIVAVSIGVQVPAAMLVSTVLADKVNGLALVIPLQALILSGAVYTILRGLVRVRNETNTDLFVRPALYQGTTLATKVKPSGESWIIALVGLSKLTLLISDKDGHVRFTRDMAMRWLEPQEKQIVIDEGDIARATQPV